MFNCNIIRVEPDSRRTRMAANTAVPAVTQKVRLKSLQVTVRVFHSRTVAISNTSRYVAGGVRNAVWFQCDTPSLRQDISQCYVLYPSFEQAGNIN